VVPAVSVALLPLTLLAQRYRTSVRVAASTGAPPKAATVTCKSLKQATTI
jgi:hypothetical protein